MFFLKDINFTADEGVMGVILHAARSLFYWLGELIYEFIIILYQLFEDIATARLLNSEMLDAIIGKISVLLGVIMLFIVIFDFIQLLLEPDKMLDKDKGMFAIIKKIIIVLVGLALSTFVFELLFQFQNYVIESKVLYRVILPSSDTTVDTDNFGKVLAARTFTAFYTVEDFELSGQSNNSLVDDCTEDRNLLIYLIAQKADFSIGYYCLNKTTPITSSGKLVDVFVMHYNFPLQIVVGFILAYLLVSYVIQVGVRLIQLTVLQIVSPMFIIGYLSPKKDNIFSKWWKVYFSTYIDIFLRVLIIYFVIYLCALILDNVDAGAGSVFWDSVGGSSNKYLVMIAMILALLTFAKKAPELIKNLLPASASGLNLGFPSPKSFFAGMVGGAMLQKGLSNIGKRGYGAAAVGFNAWQKNTRKALGNAITSGKGWDRVVTTALFGGLGGMRRGLMTTDKAGRRNAAENAYAARQSKYKMKDLGYSAGDRFKDKIRALGMQDQYIEDLADMKDLNIDSQRQRLRELQEQYSGNIVVSASKSHKDHYIVVRGDGKPELKTADEIRNMTTQVRDEHGNIIERRDGEAALAIAELQASIGKATADSKKLHQKAEEQKQGKK